MAGLIDPYLWLAAASSISGLFVLLLFAYRRIPHVPPPDSINQLRADFYALAEQFQDFVEKHDSDMGRYHAKVGSLRRKLRKLREEEGLDDEDEEEEVEQPMPTEHPALQPVDRATQKAIARRNYLAKRGAA